MHNVDILLAQRFAITLFGAILLQKAQNPWRGIDWLD